MKKSGFFTKMRVLQAMLVSATMLLAMAFAPSQTTAEDEWTLLTSESGVKAFAMASDCSKNATYVFKLENTTNSAVAISYTLTASTDPTFPPITKETVLQPNQSLIGNCDTMWELTLPNSSGKTTGLQNLVTVSLRINP